MKFIFSYSGGKDSILAIHALTVDDPVFRRPVNDTLDGVVHLDCIFALDIRAKGADMS